MLNLERIDAVSFSKGCYPGQEIVARTENLGEVKRRLVRFACGPGPLPTAGSEVLDSADRAVGEVNRSSATGQGCELLAVIQIDALGDRLTLAADGRELERQPLAYED
jgi:folate-binding Fe-S cluster repair protein YgfZ